MQETAATIWQRAVHGAPYGRRPAPPRIGTSEFIGLSCRHFRDPFRVLQEIAYRYGDVSYVAPVCGGLLLFNFDPLVLEQVLRNRTSHCQADASPPNFGKSPITGDPLAPLVGRNAIFTTADTDQWARERGALAPLFTPRHVASEDCFPAVCGIVDHAVANIGREAGASGGVIDFDAWVTRLTISVVLATHFSYEATEDELQQLRGAFRTIAESFVLESINPTTWPLHRWPRFFPFQRSLAHSHHFLDTFARRLLCAHARRPAAFLDRVLDGSTPDEAVNQVKTFLLAGHETTASTLSACVYALLQRPDVYGNLREEIDAASARDTLDPAQLRALPLLGQVWREALRLYAPGYVIVRCAAGEATLAMSDGSEVFVPAGAHVVMSPTLTHRRAVQWGAQQTGYAEADFFPERFSPDNILKRGLGERALRTYPFGDGPRICLGAHFADLEGLCVLARLMRSVTLTHADLRYVPVWMSSGALRIKGPLPIRVFTHE